MTRGRRKSREPLGEIPQNQYVLLRVVREAQEGRPRWRTMSLSDVNDYRSTF